ncbi:MAG TPA: glycosyltransferase family 2 protein [Candidatus Saccharibacteria bacterium]|nr:glycosyltransferase family 2 protein [Candidatus Saccharibacteria bacterium]HRQ07106.1 glycosyltransferase family 2 protein [Candidatus Saccharibacteria bacterium]
MNNVAVVIPNWNGEDFIRDCLNSLREQTVKHTVIVVENGSVDASVDIIEVEYPEVILLKQSKNLGFAGGINIGIRRAISEGLGFVALLNNDAVAEKEWLKELLRTAQSGKRIGSVMSKIKSLDGKTIDGTGEIFTMWGIHFPRGRKEKDVGQYDKSLDIFGASGGASLFATKTLKEVGIFDEDFFAYYEDVDLAWRIQLAGWKTVYAPEAIVYHRINASSSRIKGFVTYQSIKNLPWVIWKNIPTSLLWKILPRFLLIYVMFIGSALARGQFIPVAKGVFMSTVKFPKKLWQRHKIQKNRKVSIQYILSMLWQDLPPDQIRMRKLRKFFTGKV